MSLKTLLASRPVGGLLLAAALLLTATTGAASAAPVTYTHPSGAQVTLSSDTFAAGGRVLIEGSHFTPAGGQGNPVLAIKPDLLDDETSLTTKWHAGGPSAMPPLDIGGGEWVLQFVIALNGEFSGWIDLPSDLPVNGPAGSPHAGDHYLQLLCGLLSTGSNPCADPVAFQAFFTIVDLELGQVSTSGSSAGTFYPGATFAPGAGMAVRGTGLAPSTPVVITIDGQPYSTTSFSTTVGGELPPTASITLPSDTTPGAHTVQLSIGARDVPILINVVPRPTGVVLTPSVPAGGTLTMRLENWRNINGTTGQKVGLKLGSPGADTLACVQTDAAGNADVSVTVPAATPVGTAAVFLLAGTNCIAGGEQSDLPARILVPQPTFTVTAAVVPPPPAPPPPPAVLPPPPPPPPPPPVVPPPPPAGLAPVSPRITAAKLTSKGKKLQLTLSTGTAKRATFTVKTAKKVRIGDKGSRARTVTMTSSRTVSLTAGAKAAKVTLTLSADGRKAMSKLGRVQVVLRVAPTGGTATTKTLTLKR